MSRIGLCALVVAMLSVAPVGADQTADALKMVAAYDQALAVVSVTIENELGKRSFGGQALCINEKPGVFMTLSLPAGLKGSEIKECVLLMPGVEGRKVNATLMGIDSGTGLGFVQTTEEHGRKMVQFAGSSRLEAGQQVVAVGLMTGLAGFPRSLGAAYVSDQMRMPDHLVYVVGGQLPGACSPVFTTDGRAIGLVGRQLPLNSQTATQRGPVRVSLIGEDRTNFFWPVEEFASTLKSIPSTGETSRPSWIGVGQFSDLPENLKMVAGTKDPAVQIDSVVPGHIGEKAGLKKGDVIVALDGQKLEQLANDTLTRNNFVRKITRLPEGKTITLTVLRSRSPVDIKVTTEKLPATPSDARRYLNTTAGLLIRERVPLETDMDPTATEGLVVMGTSQNGPTQDLQPGDVIVSLNDQPVRTVDAFRPAFEAALKDGSTTGRWPIVKVRRGEGTLDVQIRIPQGR